MFAGEEVQPEQPKEAPKEAKPERQQDRRKRQNNRRDRNDRNDRSDRNERRDNRSENNEGQNNARTTVATVARSNSRTLKIVRFASRRAMSPRRANSVTSSNLAVSVTVVVTTRNASPAGSQKPEPRSAC